MKKNVLVFGLIAGLFIITFTLVGAHMCYNNGNYEGSMIIGYTAQLLAFSLVFVAIKNYRDKYNGGAITFGKAFLMGLYLTLIAGAIYVGVWCIDYYCFIPDFMDKYSAHMIARAQAKGANATQIAEQVKQMNTYKEMYKSPVWVVLLTLMEILPMGLVVTIISALILKKRPGLGQAVQSI